MGAHQNNPRKPDHTVFAQSISKKRWVAIGAAWKDERDGVEFFTIQLDVIPPEGSKLSIWPRKTSGSRVQEQNYPPIGDDDIPF